MRMCLLEWDVGKAFHWVIEGADDKQVMGMMIALWMPGNGNWVMSWRGSTGGGAS